MKKDILQTQLSHQYNDEYINVAMGKTRTGLKQKIENSKYMINYFIRRGILQIQRMHFQNIRNSSKRNYAKSVPNLPDQTHNANEATSTAHRFCLLILFFPQKQSTEKRQEVRLNLHNIHSVTDFLYRRHEPNL